MPDRATERRVPAVVSERPGPASFAIVPVLEDESLLALLYVDSQEPHFCDAHDLDRLAKFSRIVAKSVQRHRLARARAVEAATRGRPTSSGRRSRTWSARSCSCS